MDSRGLYPRLLASEEFAALASAAHASPRDAPGEVVELASWAVASRELRERRALPFPGFLSAERLPFSRFRQRSGEERAGE